MRLTDFPVQGSAVCWFVVFPDNDAAEASAERVRRHALRRLDHPSGRPWVVGNWHEDEIVRVQARDTALVVIGSTDLSERALRMWADRLDGVAGVDELARNASGSAHLLASVGGTTRSQGTLLGVRRIVRARIAGMTLAANRSDVLAWLLGADVDVERAAITLLEPNIPYPLDQGTSWSGVAMVSGEDYLRVDRSGHSTEVRWWRPPEPVLPIAEGASRLRQALIDSVRAHVGSAAAVTCDLGGVDSTSICSLLARCTDAHVSACTGSNWDPRDDDLEYSRYTAAGLGDIDHHVFAPDDFPFTFDDLLEPGPMFDDPAPIASALPRFDRLLRWAQERQSRHHFGGYGGDELFFGSAQWLTSYLWCDPFSALRDIRVMRANGRWPWGATLRQLTDRSSYGRALARFGDGLTGPLPSHRTPKLAWIFPVTVGSWVTPAAVELLRAALRAAAEDVRPLSRIRGMHADLAMMRNGARVVGCLDQLAAERGIRMHAPLYDDRVVEAGLSIRPQDRLSRYEMKPIVKHALRGIVPDRSLTRNTKNIGSYATVAGLREHADNLIGLFTDSSLGRLGLIDEDRIRRIIGKPDESASKLGMLFYGPIAAEKFLRRSVAHERNDVVRP